MKNKFVIVALIAVLLIGGMVLVSCGKCPGDGKCEFNNPSSWCFTGSIGSDSYVNGILDCFGGASSTTAKCGC